MNSVNYKAIIPSKYILPKLLLDEYLQFIAIYFPSKRTGRPRIDRESLIAGIYYLLKTGAANGTHYHFVLVLQKLSGTDSKSFNHKIYFKKFGNVY